MGDVISLADALREQGKKIHYDRGFPIFEGKVLAVSAEVIDGATHYSVLQCLPKTARLPEAGLLDMVGERRDSYEETVRNEITSVLVPFSVNPAVVNGANVRGQITELAGHKVYSLEVLARTDVSKDVKALASFFGDPIGSQYEGFRYLVQLR